MRSTVEGAPGVGLGCHEVLWGMLLVGGGNSRCWKMSGTYVWLIGGANGGGGGFYSS